MLIEESDGGMPCFGPIFKRRETAGRCVECFKRRRRATASPLGSFHFVAAGEEPDSLRNGQLADASDGVVHTFLPLPDCSCSRGAGARFSLLDAVSSRTGLIEALHQSRLGEYYNVFAMGARAIGSGDIPVLCHGMASDCSLSQATLRAIVEALERYSAGFWNHSAATVVDMSSDGLAVVNANMLSDGRTVKVPAADVFFPYPDSSTTQTTCGLAAAESTASAAERALAERIENDSFLHASIHGLPDGCQESTEDGWLFVWPAELGHYVACHLRSSREIPFFTMGLGASLDIDQAKEKAVAEERQSRCYYSTPMRLGRPAAGDGVDGLMHRLAYLRGAGESLLSCLHSKAAHPVGTSDFAVVDLTTNDVALLGIRVVRVVRID